MDELARIAQGLAGIEDPRTLLEGLFAYAPVGFQIYNSAGHSLLVNKAFLELFGSEPPPDYCIFKDEIAERSGLLPLIRRAFAGETLHIPLLWYDPRELKHVQVAEGKRVAIEISICPLRDRSGAIPFVAQVFKDVTERETLGEALRQSQKMEAIGRLAGGVAHDFNNILTIIQGYLEFLKEVGAPYRDSVQEVSKAADRAARLTQQLLAFSRRQVLQPRVSDLNSIISGLEKSLLRLIGEHIEFRSVPFPKLGRILVDPGQIEQVIINLAVNARDAMAGGGKLVIETQNVALDEGYTRLHPELKAGPYVLMAVTDTGVGMDKETMSRVFEPFFTTKEKGRGTGLGLSTVYGIIKQSGGYIWAYSEPGRGSSFKVYFPRTDAPEELPSIPSAGTPRGKETILIVEDEDGLRQLARIILTRAGYTVLEARNGHEALDVARSHPETVQLLLTDVIMPGMSGNELAGRLLQLHPETKVLFMSGYTEDTIVHNGRLDPGTAFLSKPFTPSVLTTKIREVLDLA